jgi:hypothetical protein
MLMEFEAVEPVLFLGTAPAAAERMAAAFHDVLATRIVIGGRRGLMPNSL